MNSKGEPHPDHRHQQVSPEAGVLPMMASPTTPTGSMLSSTSTPPTTPSPGTPTTPQPHLQPQAPQPMPPRVTAADLALLMEASSTKNGTYQCTLCQKQFGYKNGLIRHLRLTHVGEKPYQCNICQRRFGYKHILMEHQNLHFGNRPYACTMCDKKFAARSNLIQHRSVHKRPFHCNLCNKRFDREDQLKKHLFAHPQSLLTCNICRYAAASQTDLNKHMFETHHPQAVEGRASTGPHATPGRSPDGGPHIHQETHNGPEQAPSHVQTNGNQGIGAVQEPISPPADPRGQPTPLPPEGTPESPGGIPENGDHSSQAGASNPRGQRIDAICSHLSTNVSTVPAMPPEFVRPPAGVIIKKEAVDSGDCGGGGGSDYQRVPSTEFIPPQIQSYLGGLPPGSSPYSIPTSIPTTAIAPTMLHDANNRPEQTSALPSIHEVFSRRMGTQKLPPPFSNFGVPTLLSSEARIPISMPHPELGIPILSPPPANFPNISTASGPQRPTAQLPPITQVLRDRQTKDQAVQHSVAIPGFPSLDDVLSYYMSQGRLFKCQHCNILFFERGMYFLHASLHGPTSPWECSICHKICLDKNEFTIHFVNQQHST